MKSSKIILVTIISLILGMIVVNADTNINAAKYTESIQNLQKKFTNTNKDFVLSEIEVKNNKNNDNQPIYRLRGFNRHKTKKVEMKISANNSSDIIENKVQKLNNSDESIITKIDTSNVKRDPKTAINLAMKYAYETSNPVEWSLKMAKVNGKMEPVYKIKFKSNRGNNKTVIENAANGDKISIKCNN